MIYPKVSGSAGKMKLTLLILIILICFSFQPSSAQNIWDFKLTYETPRLIESPFFLMTAADVNKNGIKEVVVTDFGRFGDHIDEWKQWKEIPTPYYNLFVLEWEKNELKLKWKKQWDMTKTKTDIEAHRYFLAFEAKQMVAWEVGNKVIVETIPTYLGIEWLNNKYVLHEQQGPFTRGPLVGSWALPWLNASCYQFFTPAGTWPRECLVGIRDFAGDGNPKIVTIVEDKIGERQYKQILRVRRFEPGFPVEWEKENPKRFGWWTPGWEVFVDRLNSKAISGLLMIEFKTAAWYLFNRGEKADYNVKAINVELLKGIDPFDLPDIHIGVTQKKGMEEYWGYYPIKGFDGQHIQTLRIGHIRTEAVNYVEKAVDFPHHKSFLGVGFFDLKDLDGDGLDEIILVEETGKRKFDDEEITYSDVKDYIRILKWDGKEYKTMWVSPPYTKRGTKFLVEDIKNTGKKQLIVMASNGTIQIWERL